MMEKNASTFAYLSSWFATVTLQDIGLAVGIMTAVGTFLVNWYYEARKDAREEAKAREAADE